MFKVGDKVKYELTDGKVIYGNIISVDLSKGCPYLVHYYKDMNGNLLDFNFWESDNLTIELAKTNSDDAKFRAFLEEVANVNYVGYDKEYSMLEKIMNSDFGETERKEAIEELCNFYKDFNDRKKMTVAEIEKELGYKIEVVK